jgi:hypothetical protein
LIKFIALSDKMSRKKNHRIALTDKFSIIAAHHCCWIMALGANYRGRATLWLT